KGDLNGDRLRDGNDIPGFVAVFLHTDNSDEHFRACDFNCDHVLDMSDVLAFTNALVMPTQSVPEDSRTAVILGRVIDAATNQPMHVVAGAPATITDPASGMTLDIPAGALTHDSNISLTRLSSSSAIRSALPQLVADAGVFTDVGGVFGDAVSVPVTMHFPNT